MVTSAKSNTGIVFFLSLDTNIWEDKSNGLPDSTVVSSIAVSDNLLGLTDKQYGVYLFDSSKNIWLAIPTDRQIIKYDIRALAFFKNKIYVGTQHGGVYFSKNDGANWEVVNTGLNNLSIRKLIEIDGKLYAATNDGFYLLNDVLHKWELEYGHLFLQVNGATELNGDIYLGTNQGIFKKEKYLNNWKQILSGYSLHNIGSGNQTIYAMTYNELLSSSDNGKSWKSIQKGLPSELYTFNVITVDNYTFAGQWDGVYRMDNFSNSWHQFSKGLPERLAINNMKLYNGKIIVSGNERKLRPGMTTNK